MDRTKDKWVFGTKLKDVPAINRPKGAANLTGIVSFGEYLLVGDLRANNRKGRLQLYKNEKFVLTYESKELNQIGKMVYMATDSDNPNQSLMIGTITNRKPG